MSVDGSSAEFNVTARDDFKFRNNFRYIAHESKHIKNKL